MLVLNRIVLFFSLILVVLACKETSDEILSDTQKKSTVTLFQHTSIGCAVCPAKGHEVVADYLNEYGDRLQVVAIHGLTVSAKIDGFSLFTQEGMELYANMGIKSLPSALVNTLNQSAVFSPVDVQLFIEEQLLKKPDLHLNVDFEVIDSMAYLTIDGDFIYDDEKQYNNVKVCAYLLQNQIMGPQLDVRGNHQLYEHNYVLRKPFTKLYGDLLVDKSISGLTIEKRKYELNLNKANLITDTNLNIKDIDLKPMVFVFEDNQLRNLIPTSINYLN